MGGSWHARHGSREATHPALKWAGIVVAALLGFGLVYVQTLAGQFDGAIASANVDPLVTVTPDTPEAQTDGQPLNILLMGSDVRTGANGDIGGRVTDGMRNDTTILAHISGDRSRIDFVSIPRDLQVEIPTCQLFDGTEVRGGTGDFNIAFSNGGSQGDPAEAAACVINTIHDIAGVRIDHWAVVDFAGFITMVDALGGIPMCIPERIVSEKARLELEAGPQVLDGETALAYARLRTAEEGDVSGSDLQRITRQQQLLSQTAQAALSKNMLTDAGAITQFFRAGAESLTTDEELGSIKYLVGLAYAVRGVRSEDFTFATVPWRYTEDRLNVELTEEADVLWDDLRHDRPLSTVAEGDATSAWDDGIGPLDPSATADAASGEAPESVEDILAQCRH